MKIRLRVLQGLAAICASLILGTSLASPITLRWVSTDYGVIDDVYDVRSATASITLLDDSLLSTGTFRDSVSTTFNPATPSNVGLFSLVGNGFPINADLSARTNCPELLFADGSVYRPAFVQGIKYTAGFDVAPDLGSGRYTGGVSIRGLPATPCGTSQSIYNIDLGIDFIGSGIPLVRDGLMVANTGLCGCFGGSGWPKGYWELVADNSNQVPLPGTLALLLLGAVGLAHRKYLRPEA